MTTVRDCDYPWTGFMIRSNGTVSCCCYGSAAVGDISKGSPESVWNSPTMESLRATLSAGVVHTVCQSGTCKYVVGSRIHEGLQSPALVPADFDEAWYVGHYFDVRDGVAGGRWASGRDHYQRYGHRESRSTNANEWQRSDQKRWNEPTWPGAGYGVAFRWIEPARVHDGTIFMRASATNSGSIAWLPKGRGATPMQATVVAHRRLDEFARVAPMAESRVDLEDVIEPGASIAFHLQTRVDDLPIGSSFLLVDLLCDERAIRLSSAGTPPLVLAVYRDEVTDRVDLAQSPYLGSANAMY